MVEVVWGEEAKERQRKQLRHLDWLVVITIIFFLGTHAATQLIITKEVERTGASYENVVNVIEANPVARIWLLSRNIGVILSYLLVPALIFGSYFYYRRRLLLQDLRYFVTVVFFFSLLNIVNDVSILLGQYL